MAGPCSFSIQWSDAGHSDWEFGTTRQRKECNRTGLPLSSYGFLFSILSTVNYEAPLSTACAFIFYLHFEYLLPSEQQTFIVQFLERGCNYSRNITSPISSVLDSKGANRANAANSFKTFPFCPRTCT
mmetsp:Transcript_8167/g.12769  ORF Transcript_8167/g.12769 Transcript_8167/m.12769 type:complete len:128 (-) Transcript_8167:1998-2381(-)